MKRRKKKTTQVNIFDDYIRLIFIGFGHKKNYAVQHTFSGYYIIILLMTTAAAVIWKLFLHNTSKIEVLILHKILFNGQQENVGEKICFVNMTRHDTTRARMRNTFMENTIKNWNVTRKKYTTFRYTLSRSFSLALALSLSLSLSISLARLMIHFVHIYLPFQIKYDMTLRTQRPILP